ncbi:MAG: GNAT family N-acetyltransferase, partial [Planctomycetota bacterium]|jgi:RimJ/RimL family protein N-acetyltransferase
VADPGATDPRGSARRFFGEGKDNFWVLGEGGERVGFLHVYDLLDITPLIDIRIRSPHRGKGIGTQSLRWLTGTVFGEFPSVRRIEGQTRIDNAAMRRIFEKCGYVKEAHYRKAWPDAEGTYLDSVGYCILREDWESGGTTPVLWEE